jgi:anion-transporting  ArsA/GET3 family ATPase
VLAVCFGADATLTAAVWGSIRLILTHASNAAETLQDVLDMLEELSLTLPRLQVYEQTLPLNRQLQKALVDVYCEIICFYARTIHFFSVHPHPVLRKHAWVDFRNDFSRTTLRIKRMSSAVESQADVVRMQKDEARFKEVLELLSSIKHTESRPQTRYNNIPFPSNPKFSGRKDVLEVVHQALDPQTISSSLKSMALFGMGGVGKTQIALQYAYQAVNQFDIVLWVAAENEISISQSFRAIAEGLELLRTDDETKDSAAAMLKVKNWLVTTRGSLPVPPESVFLNLT